MNNKLNKIVIATGGTGGHIFPAYSLAKHFIDKRINVEIISDKRGLKYLKDYKDIRINVIVSTTIFKKKYITIFIINFDFFIFYMQIIYFFIT